MKTFEKILVANRGEIAIRIMRACRAMGIKTIAVYSDFDVRAPHVKFADEAVRIGAPPVKDSYLNIESVVKAAVRSGADAIHPGYGFLSENAEFAEKCEEAGIVFIGPAVEAIRSMGSKIAARKLAAAAGVPVVPGYDGDDQSIETLRGEMAKIGFPVLIKASAGGGGKGMRVVGGDAEAADSIEAARREAEKAFGDGALLLEKFIDRARHVEFQILGDAYGNLVHLFDRDCSLQRRHQKIIEEAPSPALGDSLRAAMGAAAVKIGETIGYVNAGTVEFILAPTGEFYFIEVNTRLQVEHPVTEMITGLDLAQLQIEIAEGKRLPFSQSDLVARGCAIEARLYAEDAAADFLPSTGTILDWRAPEPVDGLRIDSGVEAGMEIGIFYDPLLAKIIARAADRRGAIRKLRDSLSRLTVQGLKTNRDFLLALLDHSDLIAGNLHTGFITERLNELSMDSADADLLFLAAAAMYLLHSRRDSDDFLSELPSSFRNNPYRDSFVKLRMKGADVTVAWREIADDRFEIKVFDSILDSQVIMCAPDVLRVEIDGLQRRFAVAAAGDLLYLQSSIGSRTIERASRRPRLHSAIEEGSTASPMPGQILKILVEAGQKVVVGQPLIVLEAMKMEHTMRAAVEGVIEAVLVTDGEVVAPGQTLITFLEV